MHANTPATEPITLHKFRKTFASYLAENHPVELVRQVLGHSNLSTTQGYLAADKTDLQRMKANLGNMTAHFTGD